MPFLQITQKLFMQDVKSNPMSFGFWPRTQKVLKNIKKKSEKVPICEAA